MKTFTLEEAQSLIPVVEALLERALKVRDDVVRLEEKMSALKVRIFYSGGMAVNVPAAFKDQAEVASLKEAISEVLDEFASIGVQLKDIDRGLLDFPCLLDGEVVLLCWQRGEKQIEYWHSVDAGFAGRQKLDARFLRGTKHDRSKIDRPN